MQHHPTVCSILILVLSNTVLAGCITEEDGAIALYLRGHPRDDTSGLFVGIHTIRAHRVGAEADAEDPDGPGWITLSETMQEIDLLNYTTERSRALIANTSLMAGRYDQIRIQFTHARATANDTGEGSGLELVHEEIRVSRPFEVHAGQTAQIIVVFEIHIVREREGDRLALDVVDVQVDEHSHRLQRSVPDHGVPP